MAKKAKNPADYILPLNVNGLEGRMLKLPAPKRKTREIMVIYGHHASLERMTGVAEYLNKFGSVTVPDLPGFGGMEPFYKIGEKATLDNMADYLATFVKLRYKNKRLTIAGISLGFMIVTRMLQKYPEIAKKVDIVISMAGLTHKDDFLFKRRTSFTFRWGTSILSHRLSAAFVRHIVLRRSLIKLGYRVLEPIFIKSSSTKIRKVGEAERRARIDFEVKLWQINDVRTYMSMTVAMFTLDLTGRHVDLPVYHVAIKQDRYFDHVRVEEHMRTIYSDFHLFKVSVPSHAPSVVVDPGDVVPYVPTQLRRLLNKKD